MKLKATKSEMRSSTKWGFSYCSIQNLLYYENAVAYSCGVYGWSCDYYNINGVIISTGYAPIGKTPKYETVRKYDLRAEKVISAFNKKTYDKRSYKTLKKQLNNLTIKMLEELETINK